MSVILETTLGDITVDLFTDERPRASLNFLKLCKIKYYNYCLFHSVQRNFMAQTGDPSGKGGSSVFSLLYGDQAKFFEAETKPRLKHKNKGTVSMVNNGENMHGSQFFITLGSDLDYLDGLHTVFGEVVEGFEVLDKISETICDDEHRPYQDIRISHTVIIEDPFDDPPNLPVPDRSPEPTKEQLESGRIGADEEIDDTKGRTMEEIQEAIEEKEMKAGTRILEIVGDIPDAEIKPPDNVLFVCKLNPVTTDEDLEIIFSRFGSIKSCEVIRDQKSGESLQFAFVEFENVEDCERAYFKMDNVLIDDRRIHVDFSQSVAKVKWLKQGARPVLEESRKSDTAPKYSIKGQKSDDRYNLVFDEDEESDKQQRRMKKKRHKRDSADEDERKKKQRREESEEEYRRKKEKRESKEERNEEVYVDAWQRHATSGKQLTRDDERHARREERHARSNERDDKSRKQKRREFDSDSESDGETERKYRKQSRQEKHEEQNRSSTSSKDDRKRSEYRKPTDEKKSGRHSSRSHSTHSSRDDRHSSRDDRHSSRDSNKLSVREYDKRSLRDYDRHSSREHHHHSGHKHRVRDR